MRTPVCIGLGLYAGRNESVFAMSLGESPYMVVHWTFLSEDTDPDRVSRRIVREKYTGQDIPHVRVCF